jgi:hypothetical protein
MHYTVLWVHYQEHQGPKGTQRPGTTHMLSLESEIHANGEGSQHTGQKQLAEGNGYRDPGNKAEADCGSSPRPCS